MRTLFEKPAVAALAEPIEANPYGRLQDKSAAISAEECYPLSPLQQGMLFHTLYSPRSGVDIEQMVCALHEEIDETAFQRAWQRVAERHAVLRTSFHLNPVGEALQKVHRHVELAFEEQDWRALSESDREEQLNSYLRIDRERGFELSQAPLMHLALFRLAEADYQFVWTFHHMVLDGRAFVLVLREVFEYYEAFCVGRELKLGQPRSYRDYIDWLQQLDGSKAEIFWRQALKGFTAPTALVLAHDRNGPAGRDEGHAKHGIRLSAALTSSLQSLAQQHQLTLNTIIQGAWAILLSRYSGEEDVLFGATRACRQSTVAGAESMVGVFINTLPVRLNVAPDLPLLPWLKELRAQQIGLRDYEHTSLAKIQGWSDVPRGTPLFESILVFENYHYNEALRAQGGDWKNREFRLLQQINYPLVLAGYAGPELLLEIGFDRRRFDDSAIIRMLGHVRTLCEGIVANSNQSISSIPILTESERHQLLIEWNDTEWQYPKDKCLHQLFEAQVEKTPDATALTFEDQELTYRELNTRANQLAHYLQGLGVGPDTLVGICVERSIEMVVGLLAILKAGGVYLPLDPGDPEARLRFMIADSNATIILTQRKTAERLSFYQERLICLDDPWAAIVQQSTQNLLSKVSQKNLAYVIYTSGSTGRPKGVMIEHRSLVHYLSWFVQSGLIHESQSVPAVTKITFDASLKQIFAPLLRGESAWVPSEKAVSGPALMMRELEARRVTAFNCIPALWKALLDAIELNHRTVSTGGLSTLLLGGEPLNESLIGRTFRALPHLQVWNLYGPTEATANAIAGQVAQDESLALGRPIANTQIYLLDPDFQPVPIGVTGELYIGGAGLARGYLNRPELTAESFIPDPFSRKPGSRLYRTGDLARYHADGNIEFIGRLGTQVKIRGYRIELAEIESVLGEHPDVQDTVVLALEDMDGDKRLVAYVVPRKEQACSSGELRSFIRQQLPAHMVPAAFVFLDALPLTANGKLDRNRLPAPDRNRPELEQAFALARTPVEEALAAIWAEVLKLEKVGIWDNFFDLGGHSLLATQAMFRVHHALHIELPLRALFESPTVAGLAARIEASGSKENRRATPPILTASRDRKLPLSFAQQRSWFLNQYEPNSSVYNVASALRLRGPLNVAVLELSIMEIVRRHENLRTTFSLAGDEPVQVIGSSLGRPFSVVDFTDFPETGKGERARELASEEARRPFDLTEGPLFRALLIRLGEKDHLLLLSMHHIVSDGWSMGVLYRELSVLYEAFSKGSSSPLGELPIQYADYAVWQREWLRGDVLESQLSYWKHQLAGAPGLLNLATDRPRPAVQSFAGKRQSIELSKELTQALKALSRQEGVTLFMTLLAGFQTLLYRYTGQEDIVVGSPIANRNRSEIEGLIGFFVNTLVLRSDLSGNPTFQELLDRVRQTALAAYEHQDLPFEKLVEEIHPERSLSHSPLFQVFFNMVNLENPTPEMVGLATERFSIAETESKFDLTLYIREEKDEFRFDLVYRTDLFSESSMLCLLQQYRRLLEQVVCAPEKQIRLYSLVTPESQGLFPDPATALAEPAQQLITDTFASWAKRMPKQPAIRQAGQAWSYDQLAVHADRVARVLIARGLERGDVVAVHGPRSFGLIVSMVGVLLSGGVLLPIDCALPDQRKRLMIREAGVKKLLSIGDNQFYESWLDGVAPEILRVDPEEGGEIDGNRPNEYESVTLPTLSAGDPAYIFFTSGTTGIPKAVLGCHKSLSHFLTWQRETFNIGPNDRVAQLTGLSFDACLRDIFLPLTSGATLCLPKAAGLLASDEIADWLGQQQISVLHTVPSLAQSWLDAAAEKMCLPNLRYVFFVGEPLTDVLVRRWRDAVQTNAEIINLYGPTETTLVKCFYRVPIDPRAGIQPLGRPMPNTQALVLDENNRLCGINEPGEIALRTPFRSLGYLNALEETRTRFVKNPFRNDADDLIYFTGDAGRYAPDGTLEILGRLDDQVKIRGVRIEPAEVTAILARHPLVQSCIVVAKKKEDGENYLAAYAVILEPPMKAAHQLTAYLLEQLPSAMVPAAFVFLDALPLTANGKIDRNALPEPDPSCSQAKASFVAPRTPSEKIVAAIWAEVLKLEKVGIHDSFFELGGHSLLATRVISRIRKALRIDLPLRALFENPTVAGLSWDIDAIGSALKETRMVPQSLIDPMEEIII